MTSPGHPSVDAVRRCAWGLVVGVFLLAAVPRLAVVWSGRISVVPDTGSYLIPAKNLVAGRGYVDDLGAPYTFRPPTYPLFLAAILAMAGESFRTVQIVQALLAAAGAGGLAAWVDRRHGTAAGAAAGILIALDPILVPVPAFVLTEALGMLLVPAVILCVDHGLATGRRRYLLLAGGLAGAAALNTPITLLLPPWLLFTAWLARAPRRPDWRAWVAVLGVPAAVLGAWTGRNYLLQGQVIVVRESGFASLVWATTEYDFPWLPSVDDPAWADILRKHNEILAGRGYGQAHADFFWAAWQNVRSDPLRSLGRVTRANFWFWIEAPGSHIRGALRPVRWLTLVFHQLQLLCFGVALWALWRRGRLREWSSWLSTLVYFALFLTVMMPIPRYYVPVLPVLDTLIAAGLGALVARPRRTPTAPPAWRASADDPHAQSTNRAE